jgi:hypothetical protein
VTWLWLACATQSAPAASPPSVPTAAPSPTTPPSPEKRADLVFRGASDASAAVWGADGRLWVADDESNILQIWPSTGGSPVGMVAVGLDGDEADLEGAATVGDRRWFIGSHGRNKDAKRRPSRQVLFAIDPDGKVLGRIRSLLPALLAIPELAPTFDAAEPLAPKEGGIDIEGLAEDADHTDLWIGFRSPLSPDGDAWAVRLLHPEMMLTGAPAAFDAPVRLHLGGRGVRSMEWDEGRKQYWIVAGPAGTRGDFALYSWAGPGAIPLVVPADLGGLHPEALVVQPDGTLLLLSDDGTLQHGDTENKDAPAEARTFRGRVIVPG